MLTLIGVLLIVALMIPLVAVILDSQLGRALARRLERAEPHDPALPARISAVEAELERLSQELQRLEDENRFLQRLIERRGEPGRELPPRDGTG